MQNKFCFKKKRRKKKVARELRYINPVLEKILSSFTNNNVIYKVRINNEIEIESTA